MASTQNAATVSAILAESRAAQPCAWTLAPWCHPLSAGIFPFGAVVDDHFFPVGTAFAVSDIGLISSAFHNVNEGLAQDGKGAALQSMQQLPQKYALSDVGFSILHYRPLDDSRGQINLWPLESCDAAPPTDLIFGSAVFQPSLSMFSLPLSFAVPRVGATLTCLGYGGMRRPEAGIPLERICSGTFNWSSDIHCPLKAVEGRVTRIFTQQFSSTYPTGPCVVLDCAVEHGQSGGPVIDERGYVCGIISAGAENFFNSDATLVALMYPALATPIRFGFQIGDLRVNACHPMIRLVEQGTIATDGTEELVTFAEDEGHWRLGLMIPREEALANQALIHNDFAGYQDRRFATQEEDPNVFRFRRGREGNGSSYMD